jgi:ATP-dependent protease HslVU (ClpYQ) peptidase subunit
VTLIIGIKCSDGVVVGADGAATFGNLSQTTIQQPVRKLTVVDGQMIVGTAGPVAIAQVYATEVARLSKSGRFTKNPERILTDVRDAVWPYVEKEWNAAGVVSRAMGPHAMQAAASHSVLAAGVAGQASLFQFNHQCSPEEATRDLPFISIGSGQPLADPFLAFLRRIFWTDALPVLAEGILATLWGLEHAILTNAGGVARPVQVTTLARGKDGKAWVATELTPEELTEHYQNIKEAEQALAGYKHAQKAAGVIETEVPSPPPPP